MHTTRKTQPRWIAFGLLGVTAVIAPPLAGAQESMLTGLGWHKNSAGTEIDGNSQVHVQGNESPAVVTSTGGKVSALANVGMRIDLVSTAQANAAGLAGIEMRGSRVQVLGNQAHGFVNALGGAATANVAMVASGEGRKPLRSSQLLVQANTATNVEAFGAKADVLLGTASFQMPGRATANSMLLDATEVTSTQAELMDNEATGVISIGGSALANALTAARSEIKDTRIHASDNHATDIRAGGGAAGIGRGTIASVDLTGVASANSVSVAGSQLKNARIHLTGNQAQRMTSTGGSAMANGVSFTDHQLTAAGYQADITNNEATNVQAWGGEGSILSGAIADVRMSASALANAVTVQAGELSQRPVHQLSGNHATDIAATGGGAAANSIWLEDATIKGGRIQLTDNTATQVRTAGGSGSIGAGLVGSVERNGRALANSVAVDRQSTLQNATVSLSDNTANTVTGSGGFAAANALTVSEGRVEKTSVHLADNQADNVQSTGFSVGVGGGVLHSTSQQSAAMANTVAVTGSQLDATNVTLSRNRASGLKADGGILMANSMSLEDGGNASAQLSARGTIANNIANNMSSAAKMSSSVAGLARSESRARAAANSLVLHDDVHVDNASPWSILGNTADGVHVDGGTALVNALAAYRGARVASSAVNVLNNTGRDIRASGGASQVAGVGSKSNGILIANGLYMDGSGATRLANSPVNVVNNDATGLNAQGGRINANALAINGEGNVQSSRVTIGSNTASQMQSEGDEGTVAGFAAFGKGVGQANANAVQVLSAMRDASLQLMANKASQVSASKGLASANSIAQGDQGNGDKLRGTLIANTANNTRAEDKHTALANSVQIDGALQDSDVSIMANTGDAQATSESALANSVRSREGGRIAKSSVTIAGNRASARDGAANSVDMQGSMRDSQVTIMANRGSAQRKGAVNSVTGDGNISNSRITILGNQGDAQGGVTNSVVANGTISSSRITILGNQGSVRGRGTVNSVVGSGSMRGADVTIVANKGDVSGGGLVNSVENKGQLTGKVVIAGNTGSATMGGTVNSLVNQGVMSGRVTIAGNHGRAAVGGVANSVINHGVITGNVSIIGGGGMAAAGITTGSVRVAGGLVSGAAGVAGGAAYAANPGYTVTTPSFGVVNRTVTVAPGVNVISN
ncbi:hypothetical protein [Diaphorobacter sp.]|uniref:beta strand repeat-containing protein n=1 Tax=Diaphorobacter sp. TaxID=1934310 RepID=UPI0028B0A801|nr:hypothetical protein [Diaphorobacter sp.]